MVGYNLQHNLQDEILQEMAQRYVDEEQEYYQYLIDRYCADSVDSVDSAQTTD